MGAGPKTAHLAEHPGFDVEYALRTDTGNLVEVHAHTTHYIHILEGQGTLTYGDSVTDGKEGTPGEKAGAEPLPAARPRPLHAGDYSANSGVGEVHLFNAAAGTKLARYLVFNIKG